MDQVDEVLVMRGGEIKVAGRFQDIKTHPEYIYYSTQAKKKHQKEDVGEETIAEDEVIEQGDIMMDVNEFEGGQLSEVNKIKKFEHRTNETIKVEIGSWKDLTEGFEYNTESEY